MSKPEQAEEVRGYANDRASKVQGALRSYGIAARDFLVLMGIRLSPTGVSSRPSK
jgi:hypothetical protein